jgi:hypothetical protein
MSKCWGALSRRHRLFVQGWVLRIKLWILDLQLGLPFVTWVDLAAKSLMIVCAFLRLLSQRKHCLVVKPSAVKLCRIIVTKNHHLLLSRLKRVSLIWSHPQLLLSPLPALIWRWGHLLTYAWTYFILVSNGTSITSGNKLLSLSVLRGLWIRRLLQVSIVLLLLH